MSALNRIIVLAYTLLIAFLLVFLIGSDGWEHGSTRALIPFNKQEQDFEISFHIGLSVYEIYGTGYDNLQKKDVEFRKSFSWLDDPVEGNIGEKGLAIKQLMKSIKQGYPLPVVWMQEYLVVNSEGVQYTRHYQRSGFYGKGILSIALLTWIAGYFISSVMVAMYAKWMAMTGLMVLCSSMIFMLNRNPFSEIRVPLYGPDTKDVYLELHYGRSFYLAMVGGAIIAICGAFLASLEKKNRGKVNDFFGVKIKIGYAIEKKAVRQRQEKEKKKLVPQMKPVVEVDEEWANGPPSPPAGVADTEDEVDQKQVSQLSEGKSRIRMSSLASSQSSEDIPRSRQSSLAVHMSASSDDDSLQDDAEVFEKHHRSRRLSSVEDNDLSIIFSMLPEEEEQPLPPPPPLYPSKMKKKKKKHKEEDEPMCGFCGLMWC